MAYFGKTMRQMPLLAGLLAVTLLAGCGGKLNPFNWFAQRTTPVAEVPIATDPRPLIATITAVRLEPVPSGALLTATGRGALAGSWQADLVALPVQDGVLTLEFRAWPGTVAGNARDVTAGVSLSAKDLAGLRKIVVQGAQNARVVSP